MLSFVSRELVDLRRVAQTTTVRALFGVEDDLPDRDSVRIIHALGCFRVRHQRCRMFELSSSLREQMRFWERILDEDWAARKIPADRSARQIRADRVARLPNQSRPVRSLYPSGPVRSLYPSGPVHSAKPSGLVRSPNPSGPVRQADQSACQIRADQSTRQSQADHSARQIQAAHPLLFATTFTFSTLRSVIILGGMIVWGS